MNNRDYEETKKVTFGKSEEKGPESPYTEPMGMEGVQKESGSVTFLPIQEAPPLYTDPFAWMVFMFGISIGLIIGVNI